MIAILVIGGMITVAVWIVAFLWAILFNKMISNDWEFAFPAKVASGTTGFLLVIALMVEAIIYVATEVF